ncbi:hypothetical protein ACJIZ3_003770 [Penstemon smallii]|uniref:Homeobox-leucine zipper protein n=1 Tax=Penstemon smallii TaxID=265156 RepID=A0ABD3S082_9LAMI
MSTAKKTSINNRKRFSDDQIKSLETTFSNESRPELRLKQHLANKLGLQPRQVAIWFQNKRARSKSRQIEEQYSMLKSDYDQLASQMETLTKENQTLVIQLQRLKKMADKGDDEDTENKNHFTLETSEDQRPLLEINSQGLCMQSCSDQNRKVDYLEDIDVQYMAQIAEGGLTSHDNGCSFESCTLLDNAGNSSQWWDF